jgi:dienelactone hydrolase
MRSTPGALLVLPAIALSIVAIAKADDAADAVATAQELVDSLARGDASAAARHFDETMKKGLPEPKIGETWKTVEAQAGAFKRRVSARTERSGAYTVVLVTCEFAKGPLDVKVVLNAKKEIAGLFFVPVQPHADWKPPLYAKPDRYREEAVTIGSGDWALPGTLTLPVGEGPFPSLVLVHGSGPNDQDETLGPNKAFRDLAWGLASQGVAVLRYDKRTKVHGSRFKPILESFTVKEETTEDAHLAVALLRARKDIAKVFVLGHSLGGMLAPRIAREDAKIDGIVVMSGPTRPLEDLVVEQIEYITSLGGGPSDEQKKGIADLKASVARVKDPALSSKTPSRELVGLPATYWLDLRDYHPADVAKTLDVPILVLQGERDYQVTLADYEGWKKALGERKNATLKLYPRLNHHLMPGDGKPSPADYEVPGHVEPAVVDDVARFVKG